MQVPHVIDGPQMILGDELSQTLQCRNYSCSYLRAETPSQCHGWFTLLARVGKEVIAFVICAPITTSAQVVCITASLKPTVSTIKGLDVLLHPANKWRFGRGFIIAAPYCNAWMVAQALNLFHHVVVEYIQVVRQILVGVYPEIIPNHDASSVALLIELLVCGRTQPIANHVIVHVTMKAYFRCIFFAATA